jgi:hypothetical protein
MQPKKNRFQFIIVISLLTVITLVSISFYASRPQTSASADVESQIPYLDKRSDASTAQSDEELLFQTVNDITVKITSAKIIKTGVEIGICFTALDGGEWRPAPGHLFYSSYEIYPDEIDFTTETLADKESFGERCALVRYRIEDKENITTPIQFSINFMYAIPREMYTPCQEFQQRLETSPKANTLGVKAICTETSDGIVSVELVSSAKSADTEQAQLLINQIASAKVNGIWEFTITEIEK